MRHAGKCSPVGGGLRAVWRCVRARSLAEESEGTCEGGAVGATVSGGWEVSVGERERGACGNE